MTIPTRDELIERADHGPTLGQVMADFALAEIRRAVREELEALHRRAEHDGMDEPGWSNAMRHMRNLIDARLAALRQTEQPPGAATAQGGSDATWAMRSTASSERAKGRAASSPCPPPAFSDADRLRAALNENRERYMELPQWARDAIAVPFGSSAPKPVDVFEAFAWEAFNAEDHDLCGARAREWFGPLVAALEKLPPRKHLDPYSAWLAQDTLHALRQRAQEASK